MNNITGFALVLGVTIVGVLGDICLKLAGEGKTLVEPRYFALGMFLYALTAIGWFVALKWYSLSALGALYPVVIMLLLVTTGVLFFHEHINMKEGIGIVMAMISMILLARFA